MNYNEDLMYAKSRLKGTYITYKKHYTILFLVNDVFLKNDSLWVEGCPLGSWRSYFLPLSLFNLETPLLGNINISGDFSNNVLILSRVPKREDWRQGIRDRNMSVRDLSGRVLLNYSVPNQSLKELVNNNYPTPKTILNKLEVCDSIAFSRKFCIKRDGVESYSLYYRSNVVGNIHGRDVEFNGEYSYLIEQLKEDSNEYFR